MKKVTLHTLSSMKAAGEKITCLTAYDACFAKLQSDAGVEIILVGDSLGMVLQGHDSTLPVTMEDMVYHTQSVSRGNERALVMADMPFMSYATTEQCLINAGRLMQAGAHCVKIEGGAWLADAIARLAERGVPVCAHLGLTPQAVNKLGGFRVQGRTPESAAELKREALELEAAGASLLLLECVPSALAAEISRAAKVPVIGIGAGADTDAQVLVMHDMLGLNSGYIPRFVHNFLPEGQDVPGAFRAYVAAVKQGRFPGPEHGFE
ncbi:3-methyl-2-oxobutanoate hydroxymethyltransferase [Balneatrix alpica]|uniref:3-methyl-2-oxobutanoate hydroxymethyltransferase n=1 Tax=Balneatrix alpica TaxID=75684 RepID=A0ABV5ZDF1_9GAMM|nr:3-methyl-2-oxobutanoate hydroxymethyltransferase [Balneatrix alpica]